VSEAWVVNASPLILFSRISRLDLIERLAPAILIPNAVIEEVRAGQEKDPTATAALAWAAKYRVENGAVITSIALGSRAGRVSGHCTLHRRFEMGGPR
jgi:predicted nucleic acid-binding protein